MKKRVYTQEFKEQILKEVEEVKDVSLVARKHEIAKSTIFTWLKKAKNGDKPALIEGNNKELANELKAKEVENEQLKKLLGEKDLEIAILKDLIKKSNPQLKIK